MEVRAAANPKKKWRLTQFLLKFTRGERTSDGPKTQAEKDRYLAQSKSFWDALVFSTESAKPLTQKQIKDKQTLHQRDHTDG